MASNDTLLIWRAQDNEAPATNPAGFDTRNGHPVLTFDTTTQEIAMFTGVLPRGYAGTTGITVYLHWCAAAATTGTIGWDVAFERIQAAVLDIDADSFATAQTVTAATVSGTSGIVSVTNVAVTNGANLDSLAIGDAFRVRVRRDVATDTATGDAHLLAVELKET